MSERATRGALVGVRVLDLADETAVLGTKLLSDLGADVLRIEPPGGDPIRQLGPFAEDIVDPEHSLSHWWFNAGKRSAVLDAGTAEGRRRLAELARQADVVVETGGYDLDFAAIQAAHPTLTVVSVSGFGRSGPRRDWLAPDLVAWALGGAMSSTGLPGRPPLRANWALANQIAGLYAVIGALTGLAHRRTTGRGLHFDLSRQEAVASMIVSHVPLYVYAKRLQMREGLENPLLTIYRDFDTQDGRVIFIALTQGQWTTLLDWVAETDQVEDWLKDPALVPTASRTAQRARIHAWIEQWIRRWRTADLVREANRRRLPCAPINAPREVLRDEQMRARGFFVAVEQPLLGRTVEYPGLPYQVPDAVPARPAPRLGADRPEFVTIGEQGAGLGEPEVGDASSVERRAASPPRATGRPTAADAPRPDSRPATADPSAWPLAGLKILDLTWVLAGPAGTRVLADLGAELVKIEPRGVGDVLRGFGPYWGGIADPNRSGVYHRAGRNRRNLAIDLKRPEAVALIKRLAAWADVVVDNFGAGVLRRLGLGPEEFAAVKPDLVQLSLSGYGQTGPTANYPSFAAISEARAGLVYSTAYADGAAAGPSIWIGDTGAGLQLAIALLAYVEQHRRTGQGVYVDLSQQEAATLLLGPALLDASVNDRSFVPQGNLLPDRLAAPHGAYPAAGDDRWIAIAALDEAHWRSLTEVMGRPELAADPRFATAAERLANVEALDALVAAWTHNQEGHHLAECLQTAGVPAGVVQTAADLLERDPQLAARGFYQTVDQPEVGPIPLDSMPLRWTDGPVPIRLPAPLVGEHNEYVLREVLGFSEEEIVDLIVNEVI